MAASARTLAGPSMAIVAAMTLAGCLATPVPTPEGPATPTVAALPTVTTAPTVGATPSPSPFVGGDFPLPSLPVPPAWTALRAGPVLPASTFGGPGNVFLGSAVLGTSTYLFWLEAAATPNVIAEYRSTDGSIWARVELVGDPFGNRSVVQVLTDGQRILVVARENVGLDPLVFLTSTDGGTWRQASSPAFATTAYPPGRFVAGARGFLAWNQLSRTIGLSTDGLDWEIVDPGFRPLDLYLGKIAPYRGGWVGVGGGWPDGTTLPVSLLQGATMRAWWSPDGRHWVPGVLDGDSPPGQRLVSAASGLAAVAMSRCEADGGFCSVVIPHLHWFSTDGKTWQVSKAATLDPLGDATDGSRLVALDWPRFGDVSWSVDGRTWLRVASHVYSDPSWNRQAVLIPSGLLILGTPDLQEPTVKTPTEVRVFAAEAGS